METESSLPHSQVRATCPYPEQGTWPVRAPNIPGTNKWCLENWQLATSVMFDVLQTSTGICTEY